MLPSDTWKTAEEHARAENPAANVWPTIPFEAIERLVTSLRSPPTACKANREKYAAGVYSVVVEVVFADGEAWVIRLRTDHVEAPLPSVDMARRLDCEIATMRLLRQCTTIPVPTVFSHSSSSRNELGLPYTVMSAVRGRPPSDLGISRDHPITAEQQEFFARYCTSLADVHVQLSRVRFDRIGSVIASGLNQYTIGPLAEDGTGPFSTAAEYYDARIRAIEAAVLLRGHSAGEEDENRALCLWFYRLAVSTASIEDNHGPFMLTHCDLHLDNTLIDESGAIVAVLDWDGAACLPVELFAGQMIDFLGPIGLYPVERATARFRTYGDCLRAVEACGIPFGLPSTTRSLGDRYSSTTARLLSQVNYYMRGADEYASEHWLEKLCHYLTGSPDWLAVRGSAAFQDWYQVVVQRGQ